MCEALGLTSDRHRLMVRCEKFLKAIDLRDTKAL